MQNNLQIAMIEDHSPRISPGTQQALTQVLAAGLKQTIWSKNTSTLLDIKPLETLTAISQTQSILLTISSFSFQIGVGLHFQDDEALTCYLTELIKVKSNRPNKEELYDRLGEIGNNLCGHIKRGIGTIYPYLGMSTPNFLTKDSLQYLAAAGFSSSVHSRAVLKNEIEFCGSLFVKASKDFELDIDQIESIDSSGSSGELELL